MSTIPNIATLLFLAFAMVIGGISPAAADEIQVVAGYLSVESTPGPLILAGDRAFRNLPARCVQCGSAQLPARYDGAAGRAVVGSRPSRNSHIGWCDVRAGWRVFRSHIDERSLRGGRDASVSG